MNVSSLLAVMGAILFGIIGARIALRGWALLILGLVGAFCVVYLPYMLHSYLSDVLCALLPGWVSGSVIAGLSYLLLAGTVVAAMAYVGHRIFTLLDPLPDPVSKSMGTILGGVGGYLLFTWLVKWRLY